MEKDPFEQYYRASEPDKRRLGYAWQTAIGLQAVDQLKPSEYLVKTAYRNIEGEITLTEANELIDQYYRENRAHQSERTEEADRVSARIAGILSENSFVFAPTQYLSIHRRLFLGIYSGAGKIRDYNISKKEWVLDGDSVLYGGALDLRDTLEYDFETEREFSYDGLNVSEIIHHLARFISRLWQIHIFGEGNTRTTAVFLIKYLRFLGFHAENDVFAQNAWYFRNSLVRANYNNLEKGVHETTEYLEQFLRNLLLGEHNELKNRYLHIRWNQVKQDIDAEKQNIPDVKQDIQPEKQDIELKKQHFDSEKQDIPNMTGSSNVWRDDPAEERLQQIVESSGLSLKTQRNILQLFQSFGMNVIFSRRDVMEKLGITASPASAIVKRMRNMNILEEMNGLGKGKYRFKP